MLDVSVAAFAAESSVLVVVVSSVVAAFVELLPFTAVIVFKAPSVSTNTVSCE